VLELEIRWNGDLLELKIGIDAIPLPIKHYYRVPVSRIEIEFGEIGRIEPA
jgi:hypothetical protein